MRLWVFTWCYLSSSSHNAHTSGCIFYWLDVMLFLVMMELTFAEHTPIWTDTWSCFSSTGDGLHIPTSFQLALKNTLAGVRVLVYGCRLVFSVLMLTVDLKQ